ncbi:MULTISPECIES: light-harvesting antenna LH1, alpha subunit [Thiorhodovibrio]|jgi:light-harvesting complex 1 alpha chain|uniref:Alpha subunit of light-harvesting 1 complex n=1 Tax=Thiorhodovibrio winogradskyi TaxID=77007 RepID=G1BIY1_9GAMM|nr:MULTISPECIES: light-harvesting antenna LH1, alpha subunit [Thiorhodovibrio]AEM00412.1 alpha subunit of light-harvesting 1 complex [Thiorhodovibrio litoralis]MBK5967798.1 light-harvesting protein [Thiorhodovibrio winogradskyi]WPL14396.1 light-harvesting protein, PufA [Thiorhodovibrio litoralis]
MNESLQNLHKVWLLINPAQVLVALGVFQIVLGLGIHMILLSTDLNWLDDGVPVTYQAQAASAAPQNK